MKPVVVYVAHEFPARSQTFVVAEADALEHAGFEVRIYALRPGLGAAASSRVLTWKLAFRALTPARLPEIVRRLVMNRQFIHRQFCLPPRTLRRRLKFGKAMMHALALAAAITTERQPVHLRAHFFGLMSEVALLTRALLPNGTTVSIAGHAADVIRPESRTRLIWESESADFVTCASQFVEDGLARHGSAARAAVVRCGVPVRDAPSLDASAHRVSHEGALRVMSVARLVEKKGLDDCVRACREIIDRTPDLVAWKIVGDGPQRAALETLVSDLGLQRSVELVGERTNDVVFEMLSTACDVFVLPAKVARDGDVDGIPVAIMEAMSMGIPVITTAAGGIPELVVDGVTGVVVDQDSPSAIASALQRMIDDSDWARALGSRGKSHVRTVFNLEDQAAALAATIEGCLGSADQRTGAERRGSASRRPADRWPGR